MRLKPICILLSFVVALFTLSSCEREEILIDSDAFEVTMPEFTDIDGFYLLNEGNMGENKASLDFFDYTKGVYYRNIYSERNPNVVKDFGDVGNDLQIYGGRLYAVLNCSHKVEIMNAENAVRIAKVDVPNCRYLLGHKENVYVSSYVGPVQVDPTAPKGAVFQIDTLSMTVKGSVEVGYQPEEMTIIGNKLYVANSGGYMAPDYDHTISVIDLETFSLIDVIVLDNAFNLHRLKHDSMGRLWVSSRGDYYDKHSTLLVIDPISKSVVKDMQIPASDLCIVDDIAYVISNEWSNISGDEAVSYAKIDVKTLSVIDDNFIKDGTEVTIKRPYGIMVNPITKDIYVCDAKMYVISGTLFCYSKDGVLKWKQKTGDIPSRIAFKGNLKK